MRKFFGLLVAQCVVLASGSTGARDVSSFNGTWRQRITDARKSRKPKELLIEASGTQLAVKMTGPGKVAAVKVVFQIGGPEVAYIGLDGDQFRLKASVVGSDVVLDGREFEDGRVLSIHEVWSIRTDGSATTLVDTRSTANDQGAASKIRTTVYEKLPAPQ